MIVLRASLRLCCCALLAGTAHAARLPADVKHARGAVRKDGSAYTIPADLGVPRGQNLFHDFIQFDLTAGESATFGGAPGIANIFARVTGSRSYIDGKIISANPQTKLFLMNAHGVSFGKTASLDVQGSFAVTTAEAIKLADGGRFDALDATKDSLTAGAISAFGFLGQQANTITFAPETELIGSPGATLTFAAGRLALDGGDGSRQISFRAPAGRIELASVTKGDLKLTLTPGPVLGEMSLYNVALNTEGAGSRGLAVRAGNLNLQLVNALTSGPVDVRVPGTLSLSNGTKFLTQTNGPQPTGDFQIRGGTVRIAGAAQVGSRALENAGAGARAGRVTVRASRLAVTEKSTIASLTYGAAPAGAVEVSAGRLNVTGDRSEVRTGIFSNSVAGTGASGPVIVRAGSLRLADGASISGDTFSKGTAGNVQVTAGEIDISARNAAAKTGLFSDSNVALGGNGGDVHVTADRLSIRDGGLISTKTVGLGRGGNTFIDVGQLTIDRAGSRAFTGIAADSATNNSTKDPAHDAGPGGNVFVHADSAHLINGGQISASTATKGTGGSVTVQARELTLQGHIGDAASNIAADSRAEAGMGGASGSVNVTANQLRISDGARISATTFGAGPAGGVRVQADSAVISSQVGDLFTGILAVSASSTLAGAGGSVRAEFGDLELSGGGAIAGNTLGPGRGGDVQVTAGTARLLGGGQISADTSGLGAGGSINLEAGHLLISGLGAQRPTGVLSGSSALGLGGPAGSVRVTSNTAQLLDGATIAATSASSGIGGSVLVRSHELTLERASTIAASATGRGVAGSVDLQVTQPLQLRGGSAIRTTSALSDAGTVTVTSATDINLEGNSSITVQALQGNAGRIALFARHGLFLRESRLLAEAGMNGGDIFVDPVFIVLDRSLVSANAVLTGGNILLTAQNFLPSASLITATGSTAGTVQIAAPQLDLSGALAALNAQLVDASIRFQERCAMRLGGEVSSFLVLGRGGVEESPLDPPLVISRPAEDVRPR